MNDLILVLGFIATGIAIFVATQTALLYLLFRENTRLQEKIEKDKPPF
jgi:hypothetical protein